MTLQVQNGHPFKPKYGNDPRQQLSYEMATEFNLKLFNTSGLKRMGTNAGTIANGETSINLDYTPAESSPLQNIKTNLLLMVTFHT